MAPRWIHVLHDTEGQEDAGAMGCCVGEEGEETPISPFFFFYISAPLTKLSACHSQISTRKKLGSVGGLLAALRAFPGQPSWKYGIS